MKINKKKYRRCHYNGLIKDSWPAIPDCLGTNGCQYSLKDIKTSGKAVCYIKIGSSKMVQK